jgi:hypothetical protein
MSHVKSYLKEMISNVFFGVYLQVWRAGIPDNDYSVIDLKAVRLEVTFCLCKRSEIYKVVGLRL